jgi:adenylate kinase family enzyme
MKRVAVIGSPGTGKSTFAKQLSEQTKLPLIHLDYYYHDKQQGYQSNKKSWIAKTQELAQPDAWIIDGNFASTLAERLQQADTIFYFDMPTLLAIRGIVKRWLTAKRIKRPDMPDDWQEKPTWSFLWYVLRFRHNYSAGTRQILDRNKDKTVIIFKNRQQIANYLTASTQFAPGTL